MSNQSKNRARYATKEAYQRHLQAVRNWAKQHPEKVREYHRKYIQNLEKNFEKQLEDFVCSVKIIKLFITK